MSADPGARAMTQRIRAVPTLIRELVRTSGLDAWAHLVEPAAPLRPAGAVRATFLGVSTVLLDDGDSAILTDGFFSRPGIVRTFAGRIRPDQKRITAALELAEIAELAAVFVVHSHYDHALDAATVASLTGAQLLGSASTRQLALGDGLPDERITVVEHGQPMRFGRFTLTALPAQHSPGDIAPGTIETPLTSPARMTDYRTGDCYSLHVAHGDRALLIHASANYLPGALAGHHADTVYLGIGALGRQPEPFRDAYWAETVVATGARRIVPIHWDNFTRALHRPIRPLPAPFDDVPASLEWLERRAAADGVTLALPLLGERVNPWL